MSRRQVDRLPGSSSSRRQVSTWSASNSESPIGWPCAARNVKHMPPPIDERVDDRRAARRSRRACRSPWRRRAPRRTGGRGARGGRAAPRPPWPAGGRPRSAGLRRADDRRVGPVGGAERVVRRRRPCPRRAARTKAGSFALLARVEAQVLEQLDARGELGEPGAHRVPSSTSGRAALRPAEVAARGDRGAVRLQPLDRGQRGADAEVVGDARRRVERHVEVGAERGPACPSSARQVLELTGGVGHCFVSLVGGADDAARGRPGGSSSPTRCRTSRAP